METLATSRFVQSNDGYLGSNGLRRRGDWLLFTDTRENNYSVWSVHALNVETGQDQILVQDSGELVSEFGPDYEADGDWFVWAITVHPQGAPCDQSILSLKNLKTGEVRELDRVCTQDHYRWAFPQLAGNRLVVEQDWPNSKGSGNDLVLFDLQTGQRRALTENSSSSMPAISGNWLAWKDARRYSWGHVNVVASLNTFQKRIIEPPVAEPSDPAISGRWLYWRPQGDQAFFAYNLEESQLYQIVQAMDNEGFDNVVIDSNDNLVAWSRNPQRTSGTTHDHILEWRSLP